MKAKCINDCGYHDNLTRGKLYNIIDEVIYGNIIFYKLNNDNGDVSLYISTRFEIVEENNKEKKNNPVREIVNTPSLLYNFLDKFTREELRDHARKHGILVGRDKDDTNYNIRTSKNNFVKITVELMD